MTTITKHSRVLLWIVLGGVLWTKAASLLSMPFLTLYLYKNTDLSIAVIGLIVGAQPLALCFGSIVGGYLADVFKRQNIILLSVLGSGLVFLSFFFTSKYLGHDTQVAFFALFNLLNGFCAALFSPVSRAIISSEAINPEENIKFLHMRYFALNIGGTLGPLLGGYAGLAGNNNAFLTTSILYFIYAFILYLTLKNYHSSLSTVKRNSSSGIREFVEAIKALVRNKVFLSLLISLTVFNILYVQLTSNLGLIINQNIIQSTMFFSWMLSLNAILVLILQPIIYSIIKSKNQRLVVLYGFLIILCSSLILIFVPVIKISVIFFVVCLTIAEILVFPTGSILVTEVTPERYRGVAFGVIDLEYLGSAIGPAIGGMLLQYFAVNMFYVALLGLSILSIIIFIPCLRYTE